jgi:hypothetical protein
MKNTDPFAPWNDPRFKDDPDAPHNKGRDGPWNRIFWKKTDLTQEERYYYRIEFKILTSEKSSQRTRGPGSQKGEMDAGDNELDI